MTPRDEKDEPDSKWVIIVGHRFEAKLKKLTKKNQPLREAYEKKIRDVVSRPTTIGKRSKNPPNTRHMKVMGHWVLWWMVEGNEITFIHCGHHNDFFKK